MATLTPFRYPGAKNKLIPILTEHLDKMLIGKEAFCDAFVGGGSVLLDIASRYPKIKLFGNDKDYWVASFWRVVSDPDIIKLNQLLALMEAQPTLELFYKLREEATEDEVRCAYKAIFFNRTTFSGIFYSGPIGGKGQKSKYPIDCRYNFNKLKKKILHCHKLLAGRTIIDNRNFNDYQYLAESSDPIYLDPPYFVKGDSLYIEKMNEGDHKLLSDILNNRNNWVLSYDDCPEIRKFYELKQIIDLSARYCINGRKSNWESKNELIIIPN